MRLIVLRVYSDALESCLVSPITLEYSLNEEIWYLYYLLDASEMCKLSKWAPKLKELAPNENKILSSSVQPPTLELKPLPSTLKYIFFGEKETFPVVISSNFDKNEEAKLLAILNLIEISLDGKMSHFMHVEKDTKIC